MDKDFNLSESRDNFKLSKSTTIAISEENEFEPVDFYQKEAVIEGVMSSKPISDDLLLNSKYFQNEYIPDRVFKGHEIVSFTQWKNFENVSARLVSYFDEEVVLECLIDRENSVFEERAFRSSLFEGFKLEVGEFFYLRFFERQNEERIEIHGGDLVRKEDFAKTNFRDLISKSKLFDKKD